MNFFIKSAGSGPQHDYRWHSESNDDGLIRSIRSREALLDDRHLSVLITREPQGNLLLMLKSLPSARKDFNGTRLRNAVAIHASASDESALRSIAAEALQSPESFAKHVDALILDAPSMTSHGFSVQYDGFRSMLTGLNVEPASSPSQSDVKFGNYHATNLKRELANELRNAPLPSGAEFDIPVLVSQHTGPRTFKDKSIWRGMAECFEGEQWQGKEAVNRWFTTGIGEARSAVKNGAMSGEKFAIVTGSVALLAVGLGIWAFKVRHRRAELHKSVMADPSR